jgi:amino acid adenylation domain-containing protein
VSLVRCEDSPTTPVEPSVDEFDIPLASAFERVAQSQPAHLAIDTGTLRWTYAELNSAADELANRLLARGARADRIAILMVHGGPAIGALVGVVKAGRIPVVLDPTDPPLRITNVIEDAEPSVVVTDAQNMSLAHDIATTGCDVVLFEMEPPAEHTRRPLTIETWSGDTAALVYTSGSTGRPKGVMKTHRQISRNVAAHTEAMGYSRFDRIPLFSSMGTGQGTTLVWCTLLNGATLCPFPIKSKGFAGLADWIADRGLTVYVSSASIFRALLRTIDSSLVFDKVRAVRLASESVTAEDVRSWRRHFSTQSVFVHTLSSSETGNIAWSRWATDDEIPKGRLPVGNVSRDIQVLILGEDDRPVANGELGEIAVRSRYTAAGYWRDPELSAARFSQPLDEYETRLVKNGDLGRINANGLIEYCGRKDNRIKIRGNRIELSDIEWALAKLPGIESVAAIAVPRQNNEPMLVAFVVTEADSSWSTSRLRHAVATILPLNMLPSRIAFVDSLPLGAGGKIDREALRAYRLPDHDGQTGQALQSSTEILLADIWSEALDITQIGRDDDFFNLGGDSLRGAIVAAEVYSTFGVEISLGAIADHPTISDLAAYVDAGGRKACARRLPEIQPVARTDPMPLSPFQERVWRASKVRPGYEVVVRSYHITGPLDVDVMEECLRYLVDRHEILRTTFSVVDGEAVQIVHKSAPLGFSFVDVSNEESPQMRAEAVLKAEAAKAIDPSVLPISRHLLVKLSQGEHWLLRTGHALTQDGSSFVLLMNEFATLYEAKIQGMPPPIPKQMHLQYADYAAWHRDIMRPDGVNYQEMLVWWQQVFSARIRKTKLKFRKSALSVNAEPSQGVIRWKLNDSAADQLDRFARKVGATHFAVRLACFVALLAKIARRQKVVIGISFANRSGNQTKTIAGLFTNLAPLVIAYRPGLKFGDWVKTVRNQLFETERNAAIPFEELYTRLRATGVKPPNLEILFTMSSDWSKQRVGALTITRRPHPVVDMPWGCQVYIDQRTPENNRVEFDVGRYDRVTMQRLVDQYVRLLELSSARADATIGELVGISSSNPFRRAFARYSSKLSSFVRSNHPG